MENPNDLPLFCYCKCGFRSSALADRVVYLTTVISIVFSLDTTLVVFGLICVGSIYFFGKKSAKYKYDTTLLTTPQVRRSNYVQKVHASSDYAQEIRTLPNLDTLLSKMHVEANVSIRAAIRKRSTGLSKILLIDEFIRLVILNLLTMTYLSVKIYLGFLDVSSFMVLFLATTQISYEMFSLVNSLQQFYSLALSSEALKYILDYKNSTELLHDDKIFKRNITNIDSIDIDDVSFAYLPSKKVLKNVTLHISAGEHIALVGFNGSGKTTLLKLLLGLYRPLSGEIRVNKKSITKIDEHSYRSLFGIVSQNYHIYPFSIAQNILLRELNTEADRLLVIAALKASGLYEDVMRLPNGVDTLLTKEYNENGVVLSGGQIQKLAIARVFAQKEKQILIMDEASSAMDPISEEKINEAIFSHSKGKTLIMISHRLSNTKSMDKIYVLKHGRIVENGSHAELMKKGGLYAKMYTTQANKYH